MIGFKKVDISLFYDSHPRDIAVVRNIKKELDKRGFIVLLDDMRNIIQHVIAHRPKVCLVGNIDIFHAENIALISDISLIVSLPTEQLIFIKDLFVERIVQGHNINNKRYLPPLLDVAVGFFLYGNFQKDALIKAGLPSEKLVVVGDPKLAIPSKKYQKSKNVTIGIALETEYISTGPEGLFRLDGVKTPYGSFKDYFSLDIQVLAIQMGIVKELLKGGFNIVIRPRMSDRNTDYHFLGDSVHVDLSDSTDYILSVSDYLIVGQSSIAIQAYLQNVKVISVLNMVDARYINSAMRDWLTFNHPNSPSSVYSLKALVTGKENYIIDNNFLSKITLIAGGKELQSFKIMSSELEKLFFAKNLQVKDFTQSEYAKRGYLDLNKISKLIYLNKENIFGKILAFSLLLYRKTLIRLNLR